jgi:hypothetical protein
MPPGQFASQFPAQEGRVGTGQEYLVPFVQFLPDIQFPPGRRRDFVKKKEPGGRFRYQRIQQRIIGVRKIGEPEVFKGKVKIVPPQGTDKLVEQGAFPAAPNSAYYQGMGFDIRQARQDFPLLIYKSFSQYH